MQRADGVTIVSDTPIGSLTSGALTRTVDVYSCTASGERPLYITRYHDPQMRTRIAITWRDDVSTHAIDMTDLEARRLLKALDQSIRLER